jgi:hypothetical protein
VAKLYTMGSISSGLLPTIITYRLKRVIAYRLFHEQVREDLNDVLQIQVLYHRVEEAAIYIRELIYWRLG